MSSSTLNTWKEVVLNNTSHETLNKNSDTVVNIFNPSINASTSSIFESLCINQSLVTLGVIAVGNSIFLMHHMEEIQGGIGSSFKAVVGLLGFSDKANALHFQDNIFNNTKEIECLKIEEV